jgi:hypothetical protein
MDQSTARVGDADDVAMLLESDEGISEWTPPPERAEATQLEEK